METKTLGTSGLEVSRVALGTMGFGNPEWRPWVHGQESAFPVIRRALELGINFFDTADMYSSGESEVVLGNALREFGKRDETVIATKVRFGTRQGPNCSGLSRKHIVQACEASLKRLGVDYIDLYQLHRFDTRVPEEETLAALDLLVNQGKVLHIGMSSTWAWKLMKWLSLSERKGWAKFVSMQNHYNLLYREEEREMLPLCKSENIGVIPWSPLARGRLTRPNNSESTVRADSDQPLADQLYCNEHDAAIIDATQKVAEQLGVSMAQVAMAWLLHQEGVVAPILGATKIEHVEAAVNAVSLELDQEQLDALEKPYRPRSVSGWLDT